MTVPELAVRPSGLIDLDTDLLVVGVESTEDGPRLLVDGPEFAALAAGLTALGMTGAADEVRRVLVDSVAARAVGLVGIGRLDAEQGPPRWTALRHAAGAVTRLTRGPDRVSFALPARSEEDLAAILEGAALGTYRFTAHQSRKPDAPKPSASLVEVITALDAGAVLERVRAIVEAVVTVKDLVNAPPNLLYPETLAAEAHRLADQCGATVRIWEVDDLRADGFGGLLGVGLGSSRGPRLVRVEYDPGSDAPHLALVGKGITFDSGGLSLKPPASMIGMKYDMTGAATALAVTVAAARLRLPTRVTAWLCLAENLPSSTAMRPGDVITVKGGTTVEVLNTDAEGRLVLADGLVAASAEEPDAIIDIATLTGAASVAMGTRYVPAMGDEALTRRLVAAATLVGETVWPMPIPAELRALLASDVADIANVKPGNTAAGMMVAAAFLKEFVGTTQSDGRAVPIPWVHLDVAGAASNAGATWGFTGSGPTGVVVRTLIGLASGFSRA